MNNTNLKFFSKIFLLMFFSIFSYGQENPAVITNMNASVDDILAALNGGGLEIIKSTEGNEGLKAGIINVTAAQNVHPSYDSVSQVVIFNNGLQAGLGMDSGVLFSTGDAVKELLSRNEHVASTFSFNQVDYADSDLTTVYSEAYKDAVVLEFKVRLNEATTALRVAFQFGSEEYPDFVGSNYNDSFGFFVSGPGVKTKEGKEFNDDGSRVIINMARNPINQNTIAINNINGGYFGQESWYLQPGVDFSNSGHYINNGHETELELARWGSDSYYKVKSNRDFDLKNAYKPVFIEYNGLTKLVTYDLTGLIAGEIYTFKIAIADSGDASLDSGVIIQKIQGTTGADLNIKKTVDNMTPNVGDIVEFTLTATNVGPYLGHNVRIEDILPSGYEFISAVSSKKDADYDPITGLWAFETIEAIHEVATLKIKAKVLPTGDYTNKVKITSDEPDPDPTNNEDEVTPDVQKPAGIDLVKIGKVDDTVDGTYGNGVINYTFTITNIGDVPLKDIRLEDFKIENQTSTIKPFKYVFKGDDNNDKLLNVGEEWSTTATYHITDADTDAEKVENRATVYGTSPKDVEVSAESSDEQGKKQPTITIVEGGGPLMTNPHIYHKVQ